MDLFCRLLPKVDLHAHLNGSLSEETLKALGCEQTCLEEYQKLHQIYGKPSRNLDEIFLLFKVAHEVTKTTEAVYQATQSVIKEFYEDNCMYLELRTTPREEPTMTKREYITSVIQAILDDTNDIIVKLIVSIDRRHDLDTSRNVLNLIIEMHNKYPMVVVGIDLCGNPNEGIFPKEVILNAKEAGLYVTLHCGEIRSDDEVINMMMLEPDRLGHATFVHPESGASNKCWDLYQTMNIPIECCLTSNVVCGTVKSYQDHHVGEWLSNELPFSIATDDKGVFGTTLSEEYYHLQESFNLSRIKLWKISYDAVEHSFATKKEKYALKMKLNEWKESNYI